MSPSTRLGSAFSWTSDSPLLSADDLLEQPAPQLGPACPHPRAQPRSLLPESHAGATLLGLLLGQAWTFPLHLPRASGLAPQCWRLVVRLSCWTDRAGPGLRLCAGDSGLLCAWVGQAKEATSPVQTRLRRTSRFGLTPWEPE